MAKGSLDSKVAAIVVTYNRLELLKECLTALNNQTYPLAKVYIIDNASSDGTQAWFQESSYAKNKVFEFVQLGQNIGGAGGFEAGMKHAMSQEYDWLWLMDDDSIADKQALKNLLESTNAQDDSVGVLATKVIGVDGEIEEMNRPGLFNWQTGETTKVSDSIYKQNTFEVDGTSFVGFLVKSKVVKKIGLPRASFFIHFDDHEFALRIRRAGYKVVVVSSSVILHKLTKMKSNGQPRSHVAASELWKYYYGQRNEMWGIVRLLHSWPNKITYVFKRVLWAGKRSIKYLGTDNSWLRIRLEWQAIFDGLVGRLGKRIDPVEFKKLLKG